MNQSMRHELHLLEDLMEDNLGEWVFLILLKLD